MTESEEFRTKIKHVLRTHDPDPQEIRALAEDLLVLADRLDTIEDAL